MICIVTFSQNSLLLITTKQNMNIVYFQDTIKIGDNLIISNFNKINLI